MLFILAISLLLPSCRKIACEAFDLQHETMDWHFFPDVAATYQFLDKDTNVMLFTQKSFSRSEFEERNCHMCACYQALNVRYQSDRFNLALENLNSYDSESSWIGNINYVVDDINTIMDLTEDSSIAEFLYTSAGDKAPEFKISKLNNFTLLDTTLSHLLQLEVLDSTKTDIEVLWLQQKSGLIGFQINGEVWKRGE